MTTGRVCRLRQRIRMRVMRIRGRICWFSRSTSWRRRSPPHTKCATSQPKPRSTCRPRARRWSTRCSIWADSGRIWRRVRRCWGGFRRSGGGISTSSTSSPSSSSWSSSKPLNGISVGCRRYREGTHTRCRFPGVKIPGLPPPPHLPHPKPIAPWELQPSRMWAESERRRGF